MSNNLQDDKAYQERFTEQQIDAQKQESENDLRPQSEKEAEGKLGMEAPKQAPHTEPIEPTMGQKLVGLSFNPSGDIRVHLAKELCAELADIVFDYLNEEGKKGISGMQKSLIDHALMEILNAQMNVVKVLTFRN